MGILERINRREVVEETRTKPQQQAEVALHIQAKEAANDEPGAKVAVEIHKATEARVGVVIHDE